MKYYHWLYLVKEPVNLSIYHIIKKRSIYHISDKEPIEWFVSHWLQGTYHIECWMYHIAYKKHITLNDQYTTLIKSNWSHWMCHVSHWLQVTYHTECWMNHTHYKESITLEWAMYHIDYKEPDHTERSIYHTDYRNLSRGMFSAPHWLVVNLITLKDQCTTLTTRNLSHLMFNVLHWLQATYLTKYVIYHIVKLPHWMINVSHWSVYHIDSKECGCGHFKLSTVIN